MKSLVKAPRCPVRGRIVLVGVIGLDIKNRISKKELSFQVSCSYGPGRYDSSYEEVVTTIHYPMYAGQRNAILKRY